MFNGTEPYDLVVDEIEVSEGIIKFNKVGDDMRYVYTAFSD